MKISAFIVFLFFAFNSYSQIPESFNLVDSGFVSSVKSQQGGTCWTHGTMASIESNLMFTGKWNTNGETGEPDLAEYHLDWWNGFNKFWNNDIGGENINCLDVHQGGDYLVATAYLSRGDGAVRNIDGQSYDNAPDFFSPNYHYYYPRDVEWFTMDDSLQGIDSIKLRLMQQGAIATCMYYSSDYIDSNYNHYQPSNSPYLPNHSVTIVGWDDNHYVPSARKNGAWIVKNSWDTTWGNYGYFWISYYDKWACKEPEMGAVSFYNVEPMKYDEVYYYDYHGWRDTKKDIFDACNAFVCDSDQWITGVSFFTDTDAVDYKVKIFTQMEADSFKNAVTMQEGYIQRKGFHTIDFDVPVKMNSGQNFYVYLYLSAGGQPYDRTSLVPVLLDDRFVKSQTSTLVASTANPGESYYYKNGLWYDFYYYDDPSSYDSTGNFCIKALAQDTPDRQEIGVMFHILNFRNKGIVGANVTMDTLTAATDRQGDVFFPNVEKNKTYSVSVSAQNYENFDTTINVYDSTLVLDINLVGLVNIDEKSYSLEIYPNPVTTVLKVSSDVKIYSCKIRDLSGRIIAAKKLNNFNSIDVSNLTSGVYFISFETEYGIVVKKFIK